MIEFHKVELSDKEWIDNALKESGNFGCEYNFANLFIWGSVYNTKIANVNGCLSARFSGDFGARYLFPAGKNISEAIYALKADAAERGDEFVLAGVVKQGMDILEKVYPEQFEYIPERYVFDYLYLVDRLAELEGKKLHAKRNHINRFIENNPDWEFEPVTIQNIDKCREMHGEWCRRNKESSTVNFANTCAAMETALDNFFQLKLDGGMIKSEGKILAFSLGDKINDSVYDVHFEEAFNDIQGAYTIMNREFARYIKGLYPDIKYLNREDDVGLEGLRKAKNSYYPDMMVEKHRAVFKG